MAYETTTTLGELLKRVYNGARVEQLENIESPLLEQISDSKDHTIGGTDFRFAIDTKDDQEFGYHGESAALYAPIQGVVRQAALTPVVMTGQIQFTGLAKAISQQNVHAFVSGITRSAEQKLKNMTSYKEGALFRDATGLLGTVNGVEAIGQTVISVNDPVNFRRGQRIDIFMTDDTECTTGGTTTITDVNWVDKTITIDEALDVATDNGAAVFLIDRSANFAGTAYEINGLLNACALTGTYLGIARATYPAFRGNVIDASSAALTEDLLLRAENQPLVIGGVPRSSIKDFRLIWHPNQRRQYFKLAIVQRQYTGRTYDMSPGSLQWNGHEAIETFNCPEATVYLGDLSKLERFVAPGGEMKLDSEFNGSTVKWIAGYDVGAMYWRCYENYAVRKPNALTRIHTLQNVSAR